MLLLTALDFADMLKEWARPAGLRTKRHGRKGKKGSKLDFNLLDPDELVAHGFSSHEEIRGRPFGSPTFWLYEITDVIDRVSWTFAAVEGLTDIGYGTLLGIIEADKNNCPNTSRMFRHTYFQAILNTHASWAQFPIEVLDFDVGIDTPNGYVATVLDDHRYAATLEITAHQNTPGTAEIAIGIGDIGAGRNLNETGYVTNTYPDEVHLQIDAQYTGPGTIGATISTNTPGHPGPGGQHFEITSAKWLILELGVVF